MFSLLDMIGLPESQGGFGPDRIHQAIRELFGVDPWRDGPVATEPQRICSTDLAACSE
jgi:hypothetical protein